MDTEDLGDTELQPPVGGDRSGKRHVLRQATNERLRAAIGDRDSESITTPVTSDAPREPVNGWSAVWLMAGPKHRPAQ